MDSFENMTPEERDAFLAALKKSGVQQFAEGGRPEDSMTDGQKAETVAGRVFLPSYDANTASGMNTGDQIVNMLGTFIDPGGIFNKKGVRNEFQATAADIGYDPESYGYGAGMSQMAADQAAARQAQLRYVNQLQAQAEGRGGPSLANLQLQQGTERANQGAASMAASSRGLNPAMAARQAMQAQAQNNQAAAMQSAMLRQQEQMNAQQMLGQQLSGMRGQDQSMFGMQSQGLQGQNALKGQLATDQAKMQMQAQDINAKVAESNVEEERKKSAGFMGAIGGIMGAMMSDGGDAPQSSVAWNRDSYERGRISDASKWKYDLDSPEEIKRREGNERAKSALAAALEDKTNTRKLSDGGDAVDPYATGMQSGLTASQPEEEKKGGKLSAIMSMFGGDSGKASGGEVNGPPAPFPGDDPRNDKHLAILSEGERVLPRSCADDPDKAAAFVMGMNAAKKSDARKRMSMHDVVAAYGGEDFSSEAVSPVTQSVPPPSPSEDRSKWGALDYLFPPGKSGEPIGPVWPKIRDTIAPEPSGPLSEPIPDRKEADKVAAGLSPEARTRLMSAFKRAEETPPEAEAKAAPKESAQQRVNRLFAGYDSLTGASPTASSDVATPAASSAPAIAESKPAAAPRDESADLMAKQMSLVDQQIEAEKAKKLGAIELAKQQKALAEKFAADVAKREADQRAKEDAMMADIANSKVDPKRLWKNKTGWEKTATIINMIVGGYLSGYLGTGVNKAMEALQRQIDADIQAQRDEIGAKNSRYAMLRQQGMDDRAAFATMKSEMLAAVEAQAGQVSAMYDSDKAINQAEQLKVALQQERMKNRQAAATAAEKMALENAKTRAEIGKINAETGKTSAEAQKVGAGKAGFGVTLPNGAKLPVATQKDADKLNELMTIDRQADTLLREGTEVIGKTGADSPLEMAKARAGVGKTGVDVESLEKNLVEMKSRFSALTGIPPKQAFRIFEEKPVGAADVFTSQGTKAARLQDEINDVKKVIRSYIAQYAKSGGTPIAETPAEPE